MKNNLGDLINDFDLLITPTVKEFNNMFESRLKGYKSDVEVIIGKPKDNAFRREITLNNEVIIVHDFRTQSNKETSFHEQINKEREEELMKVRRSKLGDLYENKNNK